MIYKIEKDKSVRESNPGLEANPIFDKCTDRELKYVFLMYDIESPYIKMRYEDRQDKSALEAGFLKEKGGKRFDRNARPVLQKESKRVNEAIEEFLRIQRKSNTNFAILNTLNGHIDRNLRYLDEVDETTLTPQQMVQLNKVATGLQELVQTKVNIEQILEIDNTFEMDEDEEDLTDKLSLLDRVNDEE